MSAGRNDRWLYSCRLIRAIRLDADKLRSFLEPQVATWWLPEDYVLIDEIPKTGTGKFDKKVLRERYGRG